MLSGFRELIHLACDEAGNGDLNMDEELPPGPDSLKGLFGLQKTMVEKLWPAGQEEKPPSYHLVITSEFTGMGTAELAARQVIDAMASSGGGALAL